MSNDIAEVGLGEAMWDANEVVAAENQFNDEAPSGSTYVLLPVTVTALSDETPLTPWLDIDVIYLASSGETFESGAK